MLLKKTTTTKQASSINNLSRKKKSLSNLPLTTKHDAMQDCDILEQADSGKLYLIIRYMQVENEHTNQFKVHGGEVFKIGRVKFRVREVCLEG
jgi:hypothetical protein